MKPHLKLGQKVPVTCPCSFLGTDTISIDIICVLWYIGAGMWVTAWLKKYDIYGPCGDRAQAWVGGVYDYNEYI